LREGFLQALHPCGHSRLGPKRLVVHIIHNRVEEHSIETGGEQQDIPDILGAVLDCLIDGIRITSQVHGLHVGVIFPFFVEKALQEFVHEKGEEGGEYDEEDEDGDLDIP